MKQLTICLLLILSGCATTPADRTVQGPVAPTQGARSLGLSKILAYPLGVALYPLVLILKATSPPDDPGNPLGPSITVPPSSPGSPAHMTPSGPSQASPARDLQFVDIFDHHSNRIGWGRQAPDGSWDFFNKDGSRLGTIRPRH